MSTRLLHLTAALTTITVLTAGCSTGPTSPNPPDVTAQPSSGSSSPPIPHPPATPGPPVALPRLDQVARFDPTEVSRAVVILMWTRDTTTDSRANDAALRAAPLLTDRYAEELRAFLPGGGPGAEWNRWSKHRAYTTVQLTLGSDERPPDTPTEASRQWTVRIMPRGRDGWKGPQQISVVFVRLSRAGTNLPWSVSEVKLI